jgi:hypothetical protein
MQRGDDPGREVPKSTFHVSERCGRDARAVIERDGTPRVDLARFTVIHRDSPCFSLIYFGLRQLEDWSEGGIEMAEWSDSF